MALTITLISAVILALSGTQAQEDLVTELPPTLSTEGILLSCTATQMIVDIPQVLLTGGMKGLDLQFDNDKSDEEYCKGEELTREEDGEAIIRLTTNLTECGTLREETPDEEIYTNKVVNNYGTGITRQYEIDIPLECIYNRTGRVDGIHYQLTDYTVNKDMTNSGKYDFEFDIYTDDSYNEKYEVYPVRIGLNEPLYFAASVLSLDKTLELSIRSCNATPSTNYDDATSYNFIENACSQDETTNITYFDDDAHRVGVGMNTFRFIEQGDLVYLHCDLLVCDAKDTDSICKDRCVTSTPNPNARRRRDVSSASSSLATRRLTRGPIRIVRSVNRNSISRSDVIENDTPQQQVTTILNPWMIAMAIMATVILGMAAMMVVILRQLKKITTARRECLREESVHLLSSDEE